MTSQVTRDDLQAELYLGGIKDPRKLARIMAMIEAYVYARVRSEMPQEMPSPAAEKLYKCTGMGMCHQSKPLAEFPVRKQENPRLATPCAFCDGRRVTAKDVRTGQDKRKMGE